MNYKKLLWGFAAITISGILPSKAQKQKTTPGQSLVKPNIVWIVCEDMSLHLSSFGEPVITTPNLDQLAKEGVRYTNVYTTAGVCAPSRSTIITGMYQTAIGTGNMRTMAHSKAKGATYKAELPGPYSAVLPPEVKGFAEYLRMQGYYCTNNSKQDYQFRAPVTLWDESSNKAHWRNRPAGKPFFSVFNFEITHESQVWQRENEPLLVDPAKVIVPPYYPDVPEVRHDIARMLTNVIRMDGQIKEIIDQLKADGLYDKTIIFFYSDHGDGLPYVKREVLQRGLHIPLIIRFPNAEQAGTINNNLISSVDFAPTVLSLAGVTIPKHMQGQAFLGSQKAQTDRRYIFAGRDRMDSETDRVRTVMDTHFQYLHNYMPEKPFYQDIKYRLAMPMMRRIISLRDSGKLNAAQMHWFIKNKPVEELYDLKSDPYELNNLAANPKYKVQLQSLRKVYDAWYKQYGDMSELPEKQMVVQKMWQGASKPPQTAMPEVHKQAGGVTITCATPGASIGYKVLGPGVNAKSKNDWLVYQGKTIKLNSGDKLVIQAERIGYDPATMNYTNE